MEIMGSMFVLYFIGVIVVGIYLIREVDGGPDLRISKEGQKLGPTYWGAYQGANYEDERECTIVPPKPTKDEHGGVAGSGSYAGGKAVKSCR